MVRLLLLAGSALSLACAAGIVYFMHGHEVAAFLMVLTAAVLLVGGCIVHALDVLAHHFSRGNRVN